MGTKANPGKFDCYANAMPDEELFTLLARDPSFPKFVHEWADEREREIQMGRRPLDDTEMVNEAHVSAERARTWRLENDGKWRTGNLFGERVYETSPEDQSAITDKQWARTIIMHLTGRPDEATPVLIAMIRDIRLGRT